MLRVRFKLVTKEVNEDYRPVSWPIKYPYWCSGFGIGCHDESKGPKDCFVMIAYVDSEEELRTLWPEAFDFEAEVVDKIEFTSRFPKPLWYEREENKE